MDQTTEILPWCVGVSFILWEVSFLFGLDGLDDDDGDGCAYAVRD